MWDITRFDMSMYGFLLFPLCSTGPNLHVIQHVCSDPDLVDSTNHHHCLLPTEAGSENHWNRYIQLSPYLPGDIISQHGIENSLLATIVDTHIWWQCVLLASILAKEAFWQRWADVGTGVLLLSVSPSSLWWLPCLWSWVNTQHGGRECQLPRRYWQKTEELLPPLPSLGGVSYGNTSSLGCSTLTVAK